MSSEDHDDEEGGYQSPEEVLSNEAHIYRIRFSAAKHVEVEFCKKEDTNKKRQSPGRSGNHLGRVKRVVSCKRKTHHPLTVSSGGRRKSHSTGKHLDTDGSNSSRDEDHPEDMQELWGTPQRGDQEPKMKTEEISKYGDYFKELSQDHRMMMQVLSGRHLQLKLASSLWRKGAGELLTYLLRLEDTSLLVDCLPMITKRLQDESSDITIGYCVDLLPLVKSALRSPFEDYLMVGWSWVQSVLNKWWPQLTGQDDQACDTYCSDRNIYIIKHQLQDLREQASHCCSLSGRTGKIAKSVQACLFQLP
ncbi:KATNB1-like protein 1 [Clupea harengus]|uniref:KATNB1-like protein 1 n=1 Tax=Clupea harengus TaxID=7950 RepID=A0A6P3W8A2_CLUHA|nr:KATNB1-like protein 1 [Clupea harengus]